ncbi:hypothetical protein CPB84DRAFT_1681297, partial [Gymnopilus junonius]
RPALRTKRLLSYAMFDFDYSIMLPLGMICTSYRLPYQRSWKFDFSPSHLSGQLPFLASLLDRMTTRNWENRFTASEALQFFEQMYSQLTEAELHQPVDGDQPLYSTPYYEYDLCTVLKKIYYN